MQDFLAALREVKPAFGAVVETLDGYRLHGITDWGASFQHLSAKCRLLVEQVGETNVSESGFCFFQTTFRKLDVRERQSKAEG